MKFRLRFIDVFRGLAIVLMLHGHTADALLSPDEKTSLAFQLYTIFRGFTAPMFLFISGFAFAITTIKYVEDYLKFSQKFLKRIRKFLFITLLGYFLHLPYLSLKKTITESNFETLSVLFSSDVLQVIGISLLILQISLFLLKDAFKFSQLSLYMGIFAFLISPGIGCGICQECASGRENFCKLYHILGVQKDGTYAEYVVLPAQNVLPIPPNLDFESAASVPLVFLTAWHALVTRGNIKPGMKVLIHAAGSGVGIAAIQIAKLFNAIVFTTAGSDTKLEKAKELGADVLINYKQEDFQERLKIETQGEGIDLILDHVGFDTVMKGLKSLKKGGKLITLGATSGSEVPIELRFVYGKNLSIEGIYMGSKAELMEVLKFFQNGKLKPVIHTVLPLEEAQEAHRILENREAFGKVVLKI